LARGGTRHEKGGAEGSNAEYETWGNEAREHRRPLTDGSTTSTVATRQPAAARHARSAPG
jgi:hypothetical protein